MARLLRSLASSQLPGSTTFQPEQPAHRAGDFLLYKITNDGGGTALSVTGATLVASSGNSGLNRSAVAWLFATSDNETAPTFTGANDDFGAIVEVWEGVDATTPINSFTRTEYTGTSTAASTALTTTADACAVSYFLSSDGNINARVPVGDLAYINGINASTGTSGWAGWRNQYVAGLVPTITFTRTLSTNGGSLWAVALNNATGGKLAGEVRPMMMIERLYGTSYEPGTYSAPNSVTGLTAIDGLNMHSVATISDASAYSTTVVVSTTANVWLGGFDTFAAKDLTGKILTIPWVVTGTLTTNRLDPRGVIFVLVDSANNYKAFRLGRNKYGEVVAAANYLSYIDPADGAVYASGGTLNLSDIVKFGWFYARGSDATSATTLFFGPVCSHGVMTALGGNALGPVTPADIAKYQIGWGVTRAHAVIQGSQQLLVGQSLQIGDGGTTTTFFNMSESSVETQLASLDNYLFNVANNKIEILIYAGANDVMDFSSGVLKANTPQLLTVHASSSLLADYNFSGRAFIGFTYTDNAGLTYDGATWKDGGTATFKGAAQLINCSISGTTAGAAAAAVAFTANGVVVTGTEIDLTGTSAGYHIELGTSVTAITLADVTFTGTPGTDKVHVLATTGTVTITISGTTSLAAADVTSAGATVNIVAPSYYRGIAFTGLIAGSKVKVFATGTDTELFSTASSGASETFNDATNGSITVDYTIQKAGYLPRRVTGVVLTAQTTSAGLSPVQGLQVVARWYQASSGLTINTNAFADATTKEWGLTAASTLQNFASYLLEQWIALGDTGEAFANKPFPIEANGPNSFSWLDGWEADLTTYPNSISLLSRDGMRYLNSSGTVTAIWAALLSNGVPAGKQVRYQQEDGVGTTNALTTGNIDQLIQIYGDATHGNYDKRDWLVLKVQTLGDYDQAEADAVVTYGTLEDQLYVVGLAPTPNGVPAQAGITGITITSEPTPVTWNGQDFSVTIKDTTDTHSGLQIMQYVRGLNEFNWHDFIRPNGSKFRTVNGAVYGDTLPTPAGVRVVKADGVTPHPDFDAFSADNGATYVPPVAAPISWAGALDGTTVLLYNDSAAGAIIDTQTISGAGGYSLAVSLPSGIVAAGDSLRLRYGNKAYYAGELQGTMTTSGLAFVGSMVAHPIYAAWGLNGSTYDQAFAGPFAMDGTNLQVDIAAGATTGLKTQLGAWTQHLMTLPAGLAAFYGAWDLLDLNQIRQNVAVVNVKIDVPTAGALFTFTDNNVNYYRSDFTFPGNVEAGHGLIAMTYNASPFVATVSGENVVTGTAAEIIAAIPTAVAGKVLGARTLGQHIQAQSAALLGATTGAGTSHLVFTDGAATVEADVPLPGVAGDRSNVVISGV